MRGAIGGGKKKGDRLSGFRGGGQFIEEGGGACSKLRGERGKARGVRVRKIRESGGGGEGWESGNQEEEVSAERGAEGEGGR